MRRGAGCANDRIALGLLTSRHEAALDGALWSAVMNQLALDFDAQAVDFYVEDWPHHLRAAVAARSRTATGCLLAATYTPRYGRAKPARRYSERSQALWRQLRFAVQPSGGGGDRVSITEDLYSVCPR